MGNVVSTVTNTFRWSSSMFVHSLTSHPFSVLWLTSCDKCVVIRTKLMTHSSGINWVIWLIRKILASHEDSLSVSLRVIRLILMSHGDSSDPSSVSLYGQTSDSSIWVRVTHFFCGCTLKQAHGWKWENSTGLDINRATSHCNFGKECKCILFTGFTKSFA